MNNFRRPASKCLPSTPRTFLYAYSTDLDYQVMDETKGLLSLLPYNDIWVEYARVRFDMRIVEGIAYYTSFRNFNESILTHKPNPALGYMDNVTGSDMFQIMEEFTKTANYLCGSVIIMLVKRYPNQSEVDDLLAELRENHVTLYIITPDVPSGGSDPDVMSDVSMKTNGYCQFYGYNADGFEALMVINWPFQTLAQKFPVSGTGSLKVPFEPTGSFRSGDQLVVAIVFLNHKQDFSMKSMKYTVSDASGHISDSGPFSGVNNSNTTVWWFYPIVNNSMEYTLTINYAYVEGRQETMLVRMLSYYDYTDWLPFNN